MISDCFYVFKSFSPAIRPEESFFVLHLSAGNKLESKMGKRYRIILFLFLLQIWFLRKVTSTLY